MSVDVINLREFYETPLGRLTKSSISNAVNGLVDIRPETLVVGLGYPIPVFEGLNINNAIALMPSRQGAVHWPEGESAASALVYEDELPLANSSVDLLVLMHVLEASQEPIDVLNEAWRVLAPEGKLILIATNRRGVWSRFERTPFGNGRPFSRGQLKQILRQAKLTPIKWADALLFPPFRREGLLKFGGFIENISKRISPMFGGVIVVEATKRLYQGLPVTKTKQRRAFVPVLAPQAGSSRTSKKSKQS